MRVEQMTSSDSCCLVSRHVLIQVPFRHDETDLEVFAEVRAWVIVGSIERIFLLDAHSARVAYILEHTEKSAPVHRAHSGDTIAPPVRAVYRSDPSGPKNRPEDLGVLEVNIIDLVGEITRGLYGIH